MSDAIIVALITAAASVICNVLVMRQTTKDADVKRAVFEQAVNDRLAALELKIDKHNSYGDKIGDIQTSMAVLATEIKSMKGS